MSIHSISPGKTKTLDARQLFPRHQSSLLLTVLAGDRGIEITVLQFADAEAQTPVDSGRYVVPRNERRRISVTATGGFALIKATNQNMDRPVDLEIETAPSYSED